MANYAFDQNNKLIANNSIRPNSFIGIVLEQINDTGSIYKDFSDLPMMKISHNNDPNSRIIKEDNLWMCRSIKQIYQGEPITCNYLEFGFAQSDNEIDTNNLLAGYNIKQPESDKELEGYLHENNVNETSGITTIEDKPTYINVVCNGFFTPDEVVRMTEKENREMVQTDPNYKEWYDYYKAQNSNQVEFNKQIEKGWMESVYSLYDNVKDNKNKIIAYGWNPSLEFNSNSRMMGTRRLQTMNEGGYFLSSDDYLLRVEEWKKEKGKNILYVTGLSGGGKTTLAAKYARKNNAEMFELDWVDHAHIEHPILAKACKEIPAYAEFAEYYNKTYNIRNKDWDTLELVYQFVIDEIYKNSKTLYVLEGIQLYTLKKADYFKDKPVLIKGTSMIKSWFRRYNRTRENYSLSSAMSQFFDELGYSVKWYMTDQKILSELIKNLTEIFSEIPNIQNESIITENDMNKIFDYEFINKINR